MPKKRVKPSKLTQEIVRALLDYNPRTGLFTYKWRGIEWFEDCKNPEWYQNCWNGRHAGKPAFCTPRVTPQNPTNTYLWGCLLWEYHSAHRMAFLWMKGYMPEEVDHDDGEGTNNRWANLIETTASGNGHNKRRGRMHAGNPLVFKQVGVKQNGSGYGARITHEGKNIWLGTYDTLDEAIAARKDAERKYGFTDRHGT